MLTALDTLGAAVVERLKTMSGATAIDRLADISDSECPMTCATLPAAGRLEEMLTSLVDELSRLETQMTTLHANLTRLRESATVRLTACVAEADSSLRKAYCQRARDAFDEYARLPEALTQVRSDACRPPTSSSCRSPRSTR